MTSMTSLSPDLPLLSCPKKPLDGLCVRSCGVGHCVYDYTVVLPSFAKRLVLSGRVSSVDQSLGLSY